MKLIWTKHLPVMAAVALGLVAAPAMAQDGVQKIEATYGVVSPDYGEGARLYRQLDRTVHRIVGGVNDIHPEKHFQLKSAKILGGRSEKYDKVVNAFALPDGRIYVTLGLMRLIQNDPDADDELAFVVGHEVTHVVEHHSAEQSKKSLPIMIGAAAIGIFTRNSGIGSAAQYGAAAMSSHYGREDEYKADKGGLRAMQRAGYDPHGAIDMLRRLERVGGGSQNSTINGWFGSHPLTRNRIDRVEKMSSDLSSGRDIRNRSGKDYDGGDSSDRNRKRDRDRDRDRDDSDRDYDRDR